MATNFLNAPIVKPQFNLLTTELNTLGGGAAVTSSVGGTGGVFAQSDWGQSMWSDIQFLSGGAFTPVAGQVLIGWFLKTLDGTNFESLLSTPSTTVQALGRTPDFIIPLYEGGAAWASGSRRTQNGPCVRVPTVSHKILLQNFGPSAVALPPNGNTLTAVGEAVQY